MKVISTDSELYFEERSFQKERVEMKKRAECQDKRPTLRAFHSGRWECRGKRQERAEEKKTRAYVLIWLSLLLLSAPGACSLQRVVGFVSCFHKFSQPKSPTETTQMCQELFGLTISEAVSFLAPQTWVEHHSRGCV